MKITVTRNYEKIEIEGYTAAEAGELLQYVRKYQGAEIEPKKAFKKITPDNAEEFLKKNNRSGIIAAFSLRHSEVVVLTKTYQGTGKYCFLSLTEFLHNANSYLPEKEALDQAIKTINGGFEVLGFKNFKDFVAYCHTR